MKKIMFNDRYGLTKAVLEGRKTMTRRIIPPIVIDWNRRGKVTLPESCFKGETLFMDASAILDRFFEYPAPAKYQPKFEVGEIVAVAQSYGAILDELEDPRNFSCMEHWESKSGDRGKYAELAMYSPGGGNKMFVCADLMPHQIRFTNIRAERLQDITDEDCLKEGVDKGYLGYYINGLKTKDWEKESHVEKDGKTYRLFPTPREAFAALIDKVSGKGTWESNPWVYAYEFELLK